MSIVRTLILTILVGVSVFLLSQYKVVYAEPFINIPCLFGFCSTPTPTKAYFDPHSLFVEPTQRPNTKEPTPTPWVTASPFPSPTRALRGSPTVTRVPTPTRRPTATPFPTWTPVPTWTPIPTSTPTQTLSPTIDPLASPMTLVTRPPTVEPSHAPEEVQAAPYDITLILLVGIILVLLGLILRSHWPAIKKFIHKKTA